MPTKRLEPLYPDVLGAITRGPRITMPKLQAALGIFPRRTFINQPIELVLILQNMVDQHMQVVVGLQLPNQDKKGNPVVIDVPKKAFTLGLQPGEVGALRVPLLPQHPTHPGTDLPVPSGNGPAGSGGRALSTAPGGEQDGAPADRRRATVRCECVLGGDARPPGDRLRTF